MRYARWKTRGWGTALLLLVVLAGCKGTSDRHEKFAPPALGVSPLALDFGADQDQAGLSVENRGKGLLEWEASVDAGWVTLEPLVGSTDSQETLTVRVQRATLTAGTYEASLEIRSNVGNEQIPVTMEVRPALKVDTESLDFGVNEDEIVFHVVNDGSGILEWTLQPSAPWLQVSPEAGETSVEETAVTASIDRQSLSPGENTATLEVISNGAILSIPVTARKPSKTVLYLGPTDDLTETPFPSHALWSKRLTGLPAEWTFWFAADVTIHRLRTQLAISAQEPTEITVTAALQHEGQELLSRDFERIADSVEPVLLQDALDFAGTVARAGDRLVVTVRSREDAWLFLGSETNRNSHLILE